MIKSRETTAPWRVKMDFWISSSMTQWKMLPRPGPPTMLFAACRKKDVLSLSNSVSEREIYPLFPNMNLSSCPGQQALVAVGGTEDSSQPHGVNKSIYYGFHYFVWCVIGDGPKGSTLKICSNSAALSLSLSRWMSRLVDSTASSLWLMLVKVDLNAWRLIIRFNPTCGMQNNKLCLFGLLLIRRHPWEHCKGDSFCPLPNAWFFT